MTGDKTDASTARSLRPLAGGLTFLAAVAAGLTRLVPHPYNFTPIGALGLYGGARLPWRQALVLPLGVMLATDLLLYGFVYPQYPPFAPWVYASLTVNVLIGRLLCRTQAPWKVGAAALLGSGQFFLVTNFGTWLGWSLYPKTLAGLLECYAAALPFASLEVAPPLGFAGNLVAGDLAFAGALFGLHAVLARVAFPAERVAAEPAR